MNRVELHARFGLTERQAQLVDLLHDLHLVASRDATGEEPYNACFSSEAVLPSSGVSNSLGRASRTQAGLVSKTCNKSRSRQT